MMFVVEAYAGEGPWISRNENGGAENGLERGDKIRALEGRRVGMASSS